MSKRPVEGSSYGRGWRSLGPSRFGSVMCSWKIAGGRLVAVRSSSVEGSNASSGEGGHDSDARGEPEGRFWSGG